MPTFSRTDLINKLIRDNHYKSYLEIGINVPGWGFWNFEDIKCETKVGVDPVIEIEPKTGKTFKMTSDEFFSKNKYTFDIVFIDGLHLHEQVLKDINNSLKFLSLNGTIVVHDCNPPTRITAQRKPSDLTDAWHGDVWKAIYILRIREDLDIKVLDMDEGCAIIKKGSHDAFEYMSRNRTEILNLTPATSYMEHEPGK